MIGEDRGKNHDHEDDVYVDPHGHHDIVTSYLSDYAEANEGESCVDQCAWMQAQNTDPHYASVFCYSAEEHGWSPSSPKWDVRMEVRCQEGDWADKSHGHRRRRHDLEDGASHEHNADGSVDYDEVRGGGHDGGHGGGNGGGKGKDHGEYAYKPRWFYCNGKFILIS